MMTMNKITTMTMIFTVTYAVLYAICTEFNIPLVTYHPVIGEVDLAWKPPRSGPAMYWYGWMLTSLVGAAVLAFLATFVPEQWLQRIILFAVAAAIAYLVVYSVALSIYERATIEMEFLKSRWLSAGIAAVVAAGLTLVTPITWSERLWPGWTWLVPVGSLMVLGYYLVPYFTR
jgi:hypothetical protein